MPYRFSAHTVRRTTTLEIDGDDMLKLVPNALNRRTRLIWAGSPNVPVIRLTNCAEPYLADIDFAFETPASAAVEFHRTGNAPRPATMPMVDRVRVFGDNKVGDAFQFTGIGSDENNEHGTFRNCKAFALTGYFCHVTEARKQSKEHVFEQCCLEGGIAAVRAPSSFMWWGGTVSGTSEAAFQLYGGGGDRVRIAAVGVEACHRVLDVGSEAERSTDGWKVSMAYVRFAADRLAADGAWVRLYHTGPVTVQDCQIGGGKVPVVPHIWVDSTGIPLIRLSSNWFDAFGAHRVSPVWTAPGREVIVDWGFNMYSTDQGDPVRTRVLGTFNPPKE